MDEKSNHILVIDDDELIINLVEGYLSDLGYRITSAKNAEEAIEKMQNGNNFNLVLSDVNLPGKSGIDLLKIINQTKSELPVVLLTGMTTLETAITALQYGAEDYITKPFDLRTIKKVIEKVFKKQKRFSRKEKIYENIEYIKLVYNFNTFELEPGILARELAEILQKMQFSEDEYINQYELTFTETLLNGLEHGNLELPSSIKSNDLLQMAEFDELRDQRLQEPEYANRTLRVVFECEPQFFSFTVKDGGPGFDWKKYLDKNHKINNANTDCHGRGFFIIKHIIDEVYFNEAGNMITLIKHKNT